MRQVVFLGGGYSARAYARLYGKEHRLIGTTRDATRFDRLAAVGIKPLLFDGKTLTPDLRAALEAATDLVISVSPSEEGDAVLALLEREKAALPALEWIGYLSTIGVYGDHGGDWVNEDSETRSALPRAQWRAVAEQGWQRFAQACGVPCAVLRLGGIYGPGRNSFLKLEDGTARCIVKPGQVVNWVHVADIAGSLDFLMGHRESGVFNVVDDEPAPSQDKVAFAAELMGIDPPPAVAFDDADLSPFTKSFFAENRRVSNARLRDRGYVLHYPNFRIALLRLWQDDTWHLKW